MTFEPLDIAACYGTDWTAKAIRIGTASPLFAPFGLKFGPSHVAVMAQHEGRMLWTESTTLCAHPCLIRGKIENGCQAHEPGERIADYVDAGGRVDIWRLDPIQSLSMDESELASRIIVRHFIRANIHYDMRGAMLSGTRFIKRLWFLFGARVDEVFCSELIAHLLMRLGRMNIDNPTKYNPASLLRTLVWTGMYKRVRTYSKEGISCAA